MTGRSSWADWHDDYDIPSSDLAQRLAVVQLRLREAIDRMLPGPIRLISACAGQGRDVVGALGGHRRAPDVSGLLVELDADLVADARRNLDAAGLTWIRAVRSDAGTTDPYRSAAPADVVLLCGIFGNVSQDDVRNTVMHASMLCTVGATVIWTRHRRPPDRTPAIRGWFRDAGFAELAFDSPGEDRFAVGTQRLRVEPEPFETGRHLFAFV
jgi:hypothetical protein